MTDSSNDDDFPQSPSNNNNPFQKFYIRKMHYQGSLMVNICDEELLGKNIESDTLNINITSEFFNEIVNEKDITTLLKKCSIANLIGKRVVDKTLSLGLAKRDSIKVVSVIPFEMICKFQQNY